MRKPILYSLFLGLIIGQSSCKSGDEKSSAQTASLKAFEVIKVFKYDGSQQCGFAKGQSLEMTQKELKGIPVLSSKKLSDGLMRTQVCGSPTGIANVFEIPKSQVKKAEKLGFQLWKF